MLIERFNIEVGNIGVMINVDHNNNITENNDGNRSEGIRIFCILSCMISFCFTFKELNINKILIA
jgi:hypothetical protein